MPDPLLGQFWPRGSGRATGGEASSLDGVESLVGETQTGASAPGAESVVVTAPTETVTATLS
jgi:hypothetical protein